MTQITIEQTDQTLVATITNPPEGYMNEETAGELMALLDRVEADDTVRSVILTGGISGTFIRHYDVRQLHKTGEEMADKGYAFDPLRPVPETPFLKALRRIELMPKPFIAAINGTAMGGGFELALACDIRLAADGPYDLGLPEINIGLLPGAGGTQRLSRLIGEGRALELILSGATFSPERAEALGIVSRCVKGDVLVPALKLAHHLSGLHPKAVAHIKRLVRGSTTRDLDEGLATERTLFCDLMVDRESLALMSKLNRGDLEITNAL